MTESDAASGRDRWPPRIGQRRSRRALVGAAVAVGSAVAWPGLAGAAAVIPSPPAVGRVRLAVAPNPAGVDEALAIRVTGLAPGREITLRAEQVDAADVTWQAEALFRADPAGTVDPAAQAQLGGTYDTADPMGLVWSAVPLGAPAGRLYAPALAPGPLTIAVEAGGVTLARVVVSRELQTPAVTSVGVDERGLVGRFFRPAGDAPVPAVLVLGGSEGGLNPYGLRQAALLARHGFAALALAYFGVGSLPPRLEEIPLEYFAVAVAWLRARPDVRGDRLAVVGASRGGELALLLGATYPVFRAVVSYVGSGIGSSSWPPSDPPIAAWTRRGAPVPYASAVSGPWSWGLAEIPVERINGPVLLLSGEEDAIWSSTFPSQIAMERLRRLGHPYPDEHRRYPGAGHLILPPYLPTTHDARFFGGIPAGTAAANADSWPRVRALLADRLLP